MTHEELIGVIDSYSKLAGISDAWLALRAVVELHKPVGCNCKDGIPHLLRCVGCTTEKFALAYPCPTIQAIEKELK